MPSAWPVERKNGQVILPRAPWTLTRKEMRDVKEMKTLKDFVTQNAWPEGSMSKGWLIQEGIVFISQYLHQAASSLPHPFSIRHSMSAMDVREEDGPTIVPQGMGRNVNLGHELRAKRISLRRFVRFSDKVLFR
jgi:hypothetical protein